MLDLPVPEGARRFRILARVSDDKLRSIPQQVADCKAYAEAQGGAVDRVYNVGEHSGFSIAESAVYQRLLADARAGEFHALVVRDTSRLGRDYWEKLGTLRDLRAARVEFHVVEDGGRFDFEDAMSKVKSWAATWADESRKREEIRKSVRATAARRDMGYPTQRPPLGYRSVRDKATGRKVWRASPDADTVRRAFAAVLEGKPLAGVQAELGLTYHQLDRLLRNRCYTGGFTWNGAFRRCAPEVVPPLVSDAVFDAVQAARRTRGPAGD